MTRRVGWWSSPRDGSAVSGWGGTSPGDDLIGAGARRARGAPVAARLAATLLAASLLVAACGGSVDESDARSGAGDPGGPSTVVSMTDEASAPTAEVTDPVVVTVEPDGTRSDRSTILPAPDPDRPMPTGGAAMAADLVEAERAIRDPAVGPDEAAAWGRRQQRLYHHLADHSEWVDRVLAADDAIEGEVARAIARNWEARVALQALVESEGPHAELPAWRVVEPRPVDELLGHYRRGQAEWGIEWPYLAAINLIETRMGRIEGLSSVGAVGPMQFLPTTWAACCAGDPTDPADAIPGAARYLTIRGGPEDMQRAIWGYNNSDHYVAAVTAYAEVMAENELAYRGYHAWEIFFRSTEGLILIPVGYDQPEPVPAAEWVRDHPESRITG